MQRRIFMPIRKNNITIIRDASMISLFNCARAGNDKCTDELVIRLFKLLGFNITDPEEQIYEYEEDVSSELLGSFVNALYRGNKIYILPFNDKVAAVAFMVSDDYPIVCIDEHLEEIMGPCYSISM